MGAASLEDFSAKMGVQLKKQVKEKAVEAKKIAFWPLLIHKLHLQQGFPEDF